MLLTLEIGSKSKNTKDWIARFFSWNFQSSRLQICISDRNECTRIVLDCRKLAYALRTTSRVAAASSTCRRIRCWGSWAPARTRSLAADSWSTIRVNWRIGISVTSVIATRTGVSPSRYVYNATRVEIDIKLTPRGTVFPMRKVIVQETSSFHFSI